MAEGEGVVSATMETARAHPAWVVGGVVGLVAVLWLVSRKKAKEPQAFSFNYGPSDAQVQAGTQLAIAQQADQTQVTLANINATASSAAVSSYFDYLTNHSKDQLAAANAGFASANHIADVQGNTAGYIANVNAQATMHGQDTVLAGQEAGYSAQTTQAQIKAASDAHYVDTQLAIAQTQQLGAQQYKSLSDQINAVSSQQSNQFAWTQGAIQTVQSAGNSLSNWAGDAVAKLGAIISGNSQRLANIGA